MADLDVVAVGVCDAVISESKIKYTSMLFLVTLTIWNIGKKKCWKMYRDKMFQILYFKMGECQQY